MKSVWRNFVDISHPHGFKQYRNVEKYSLFITKIISNVWSLIEKLPYRNVFKGARGLARYGSEFKVRVERGNLQILKRVRDFSKGHDILPQTEYCQFISECGLFFGSRFSKLVSQNFGFIDFMIKYKNKGLFPQFNNVLLNWRQVLSGGIDSGFGHIRKYCEHHKQSVPITAEQLVQMVERNRGAFLHQPYIGGFTPQDLESVKFNKDAKPGYFTSKIFGSKRIFSWNRSLKVAKMFLQLIFERPMMYTGLWELGGREKDINLDKEGEVAGTRIVMMCEEVLTIISGYFVQYFTKLIQRNVESCIFIGRNYDYETIKHFEKLNDNFDFCIDGDWENFDANVKDEYILAACAILRRSLPRERKYHRYFFFIAASLIIKFVAIPPNRVYRILKGIPSGHGFTSLVGSIVNYLYMMQIGEMIYGEGLVRRYMYIKVSGDDVKAWLKWHKNLLFINDYVRKYIPGECGDLLKSLVPCKMTGTEYIHTKFLKRRVDNYFNVCWDRESFFRKIIYSKRRFRYYSEILEWMKMWVETAPFDQDINEMCLAYVKFASKNGTTLYDTNKEFLFSMLEHDFECIVSRGMTKVLCPKVQIFDNSFATESRVDSDQQIKALTVAESCNEIDVILHAMINFGAGPITYYREFFFKKLKDWSFHGLVKIDDPPAYRYLVRDYYTQLRRRDRKSVV